MIQETHFNRPILLLCLVLFLKAPSCTKRNDKPAFITPVTTKELVLDDQEVQTDDTFIVEENEPDSSDASPNQLMKCNTKTAHQKKSSSFDFEDQIQSLRQAADQKRGINWTLSGDTLLRDATNVGDNLYAPEDYVVQIMNIYRAAKKICTLHGKNGALFAKMASTFMHQYKNYAKETEDFWVKEVKNLNRDVVLKLHQMVFPDENELSINKKLRLAENYVGLDDRHYNVTTRFKVENKQFALEDKKWLTLTEKQRSAFINRKSADWYKRLEPFEQKLIDAYLDKLLDGAHYIPTQIRNIPGCRNAYQKRILAYDENNNQTVLGHYYHSAALVSPIQSKDKATDIQITKSNWEQICNHNKNIEVISLNHNLNFSIPFIGFLGERNIVEQTNHVVGSDRFIYLPINEIGTLTTPIFKNHVKKLLKESVDFYDPQYGTLCNTLKENDLLAIQAQIEQIQNPKDKSYFKRLALLKEASEKSDKENKMIHNCTKVFDNYYADIGSNYIACKTILGQSKGTSTASILFSCKSGKDRTGFMSYLVDGNIIEITNPSLSQGENGKKIYNALAYASHPQFLSSLNGGMPGRFGMKSVRKK